MNVLAIGAGAGLVSALLIAVVAQATPLALLLFLLAPIPVLVVALGWNHRAGLVATLVGGIATAAASSLGGGLAFAIGTGLPAWWLAYLALLGRPLPDGTVEWYPLGNLLAWIAATAALTYLAAAMLPDASFETYQRTTREAAETILRVQTGTPDDATLPSFGDVPAQDLVERLAGAAPLFAAQGFTIVLIFYVWLSARIVAISGRLARPWPFVPATLMPRATLAILAGAILVSAMVDGFVGVFALGLAGALAAAFGLQALAAMHELTVGRSGRVFLLAATYMLIFLSQGLVLLALMLFGIADTALGIREKARSRKGPPGKPTS